MKVKHYINDRLLSFEFNEELDHHKCDILKRRIDYEIQRFIPKKVIFDFNMVLFMDSAAIGLIIGRYKTIQSLGGEIELINVSKKLKRILEMSGILSIISINTDIINSEKIS